MCGPADAGNEPCIEDATEGAEKIGLWGACHYSGNRDFQISMRHEGVKELKPWLV